MDDKWVSYQFDTCISFIGSAIEGACNELDKDGNRKYNLADLLRADYKLPRPLTEKEKQKKALQWYKNMAVAGRGVKVFKGD